MLSRPKPRTKNLLDPVADCRIVGRIPASAASVIPFKHGPLFLRVISRMFSRFKSIRSIFAGAEVECG